MKRLFLIVSVMLLLTSCNISSVGVQVQEQPTEHLATSDYESSLVTVSAKIKDTPEFAECMEPAVNMCINSVGMQLAQKTRSTEFCNELPEKEQQENCQFAITLSNAREQRKPEMCDSLGENYKTQCTVSAYKNIAVETKDIQLCTKIVTALGNQTETQSGSSEGLSLHRDQCILGIAVADTSLGGEFCDSIVDPSTKDTCIQVTKNRSNP